MIRDIYLETACACGLVLIVAGTVVLLKLAFTYVFGSPKAKIIVPNTRTNTLMHDGPRQMGEPVKIEPRKWKSKRISRQDKSAAAALKIEKSPVLVAPKPASEPEPYVECANCHGKISSAPYKEDPSGSHYQCEHCGTNVMMPF